MPGYLDCIREGLARVSERYDGSAIEILEGLEPVRKRPGMYIGSTGPSGLHHLIYEIVDNAVDEAMAGVCRNIDVTLLREGGVRVQDDGRGIPVDLHPAAQVPTVQVVFTVLHAGGKFGGVRSGYRATGGLHGVGASVVTALSARVIVEIVRAGAKWRQVFSDGGREVGPLESLGAARGHGTTVTFWPDPAVFKDSIFERHIVAQRLRQVAYLNAGLRLTLRDERRGEDADGAPVQAETFHHAGGLREFVADLTAGEHLVGEVLSFSGNSDDIEVEVAFAFLADGYAESIQSYCNSVPTPEGGTHEVGLRSGLTRAVNDYAKRLSLVKKQVSLSGEDIREGLKAVISVRVVEPEFEGQTKTKLGTMSARAAVESVVVERFGAWLEQHPEPAAALVAKSVRAQEAREAAKKARDKVRSGKKKDEALLLSGKLAPAQVKDPSRNELFLVEGDSAGGSAKQARNRSFQAILPLRGKVLNCEGLRTSEVLQNEELSTLVHALGCGIGDSFDLNKCHYAKVIALSDADDDGAHIQALLLTFFYRHLRGLLTAGRVYIVQPPLFRVATAKESEYVWDDKSLRAVTQRLGAKSVVTRFKGLGEMNPEQLRESAMTPDSRRLIAVTIEDAMEAERFTTLWMNDRHSEARKTWITEHVPMGGA